MNHSLGLKKYRALAFATALLIVPTGSYAGAKASHIEIGKSGFALCMSRFPETRETTTAFKEAGWRFLGILGSFRAYTNAKNRVIAATAVTNSREQGCFTAVHKMTEDEALAFIEVFLADAKSVKQSEPTERQSIKEWTAVFKGRKVRFAASKSYNYRIMRGTSVQMITE